MHRVIKIYDPERDVDKETAQDIRTYDVEREGVEAQLSLSKEKKLIPYLDSPVSKRRKGTKSIAYRVPGYTSLLGYKYSFLTKGLTLCNL